MVCLIKNIYAPIVHNTEGLINRAIYSFYDGEDVYNSDVILILIAKRDWNAAYAYVSPTHLIRLFMYRGSKVIYKRVSSVEEIDTIMLEQRYRRNHIHGLWIKAHGSTYTMSFDSRKRDSVYNHTFIDTRDKSHKLLRYALSRLEPNAVIILESCQTGRRGPNNEPCLAEKMAKIAPGRLVIATSARQMGLGSDCQFIGKTLKATFLDFRVTEQNGILPWLNNAFHYLIFSITYGELGKDNTVKYIIN